MKPEQQSLVVALRVRPMNQAEVNAHATEAARAVDNHLVVLTDSSHEGPEDVLRANRPKERTFAYDVTFGPSSTQAEVYEKTTRALVDSVAAGYHATVFAYGPTGAGKTYTMLGTDSEPGIVVLTLNDLFQRMEDTKDDVIYRTSLAYLEVYNEMIRDLLQPTRECLELREDSSGEAVVAGLVEVETRSAAEVLRLVRLGSQRRMCEPTAVNKTSSRSHAIIKLTVEQRSRVMDISQEVKTGVLYMVDLAGSERAAVTKNQGKRMIEAAHINKSLLALANCINTLGGVNYKGQFVNYRDSKLTRLLKDSLGGSRRTTMIAHISPASTSVEESRNTLNYAERAKYIKVKPQQNIMDVSYHISQYHQIIAELRAKIEVLQGQLLMSVSSEKARGPTEGSCLELSTLLSRGSGLHQEYRRLRQELLGVECALLQNAAECQKHTCIIREWEEEEEGGALGHRVPRPSGQSPASTDQATSPEHVTSCDQELPSYEEGVVGRYPCSLPAPMGRVLEPLLVSAARGELATLTANKQRLRAHQKSLKQKLKANRSAVVDLQQQLLAGGKLGPLQREVVEVVMRASQLEEDGAEHLMAALVGGAQLGQERATSEELRGHAHLLLQLVQRQRSLMSEAKVTIPAEVEAQYTDLCRKQKSLAIQMAVSKQFDLTTNGLELPSLVHMSAHLSAASGSKSNLLLLEDGTTDSRQPSPLLALSDIKLPPLLEEAKVKLPPLDASFTFEPVCSVTTPPSIIKLPPLDASFTFEPVCCVTTPPSVLTTPPSIITSPSLVVPSCPLPVSTTSSVKEATPTAGETLNHTPHLAEAPPTEAIVGKPLLSAKKTSLLSKVASFTPPYMGISRNSSKKYRVREPKGEGKTTPLLKGEGKTTPLLQRAGKKKKGKKGSRGAAPFIPVGQPYKASSVTLAELERLHPTKPAVSRRRKAPSPGGEGARRGRVVPPKSLKLVHKVDIGVFTGSPYLESVKQNHKRHPVNN